jgi:hypothetical protein
LVIKNLAKKNSLNKIYFWKSILHKIIMNLFKNKHIKPALLIPLFAYSIRRNISFCLYSEFLTFWRPPLNIKKPCFIIWLIFFTVLNLLESVYNEKTGFHYFAITKVKAACIFDIKFTWKNSQYRAQNRSLKRAQNYCRLWGHS